MVYGPNTKILNIKNKDGLNDVTTFFIPIGLTFSSLLIFSILRLISSNGFLFAFLL
jgi:hypothetical protein